jgi:acetate kinase
MSEPVGNTSPRAGAPVDKGGPPAGSGSANDADDLILVLNSGSSSLKFGVFALGERGETAVFSGGASDIGESSASLKIRSADHAVDITEQLGMASQGEALREIARMLDRYVRRRPVAVGHRVVHGGPHLREHSQLTPEVLRQLEAAVHFAPLHIPQSLELIRQAQKTFADIPHFACFDTAFHRTLPERASTLPVPRRYRDEGVIRYGFHGLSYESLVSALGDALPPRAVLAHLGSGSSVCAVRDGKSIDTSMGFTPTGGVPMATRSGDLDPGVLLFMMRTGSLDADRLESMLNHECGIAALAGQKADMQTLLERRAAGDAGASLAIDVFCTAVRKQIGAYAALMGGIDLLVFTGGIGEHSDTIREAICAGLECVGLHASADARADVRADARADARADVRAHGPANIKVVPAAEERQIALHCRALLSRETPRNGPAVRPSP